MINHVPFKEIVLEHLKYHAHRAIPMHPDSLDANVVMSHCADELLARLTTHLMGSRKDVKAWWYWSWWDHTKARWFPKWWLRRWPPRVQTMRVHVDTLFPELEATKGRYQTIVVTDAPSFVKWPEEGEP